MGESNIILFSLKGTDLLLAKNISKRLSISLGTMECRLFANKETKLTIETSVRNRDVYVLQVMDNNPNDCIMELLMMCYALKTACCRKVIVMVPYLPYSKQSKMRNRGAIPAKLLAKLLCRAGMDHMLTMDLHSKEVQGFYDCPVDNLRASPFLIQYIQERIPDYFEAVIVARHPGAAARANSFAERLQLNIAVLHGEQALEESDQCDGRNSPPAARRARSRAISEMSDRDCSEITVPLGMPTKVKKPLTIVGDVKGKIAIIVEDIVDDAAVLCDAAKILKMEGANKIYVVATHGLFSGDAPRVLMESPIDEVIVTNTVPLENKLPSCPKIRSVDISPVLSEAVRRIHNGESMSYLFRNIPLED
ncbi:phosphoribosyl pyrophosphate synthase-associated protein 1-like isoform X2 [Hydractinia symbiolongicarpus]|uniref:phosphoribosyl pyrophosphate synthase-associated protein 1-like isoform X2 n=1 Tax=Hydractinia symbiolongicarpus TaxID=13093 RepID=UPI00254A19BE|nr:phosphoribosyl pyrophosphate synthase-associated protein 1-like isoform X2 [Hydractinia symbiolongicarpus]